MILQLIDNGNNAKIFKKAITIAPLTGDECMDVTFAKTVLIFELFRSLKVNVFPFHLKMHASGGIVYSEDIRYMIINKDLNY